MCILNFFLYCMSFVFETFFPFQYVKTEFVLSLDGCNFYVAVEGNVFDTVASG